MPLPMTRRCHRARPGGGERFRTTPHSAPPAVPPWHAPPAEQPVRDALSGAVERAHLRKVARHQTRVAGPGRQRLVQVQDIEPAGPHGAHGAHCRARTERNGGDRPVGGERRGATEPDEATRGEARHVAVVVGGREDDGVVTSIDESRGEADHLALHAAGPAQAVRAQ